jgi:hypothetical protein
VVAERFQFHRTKQKAGQPINEFVSELRKMATTCDFVGGQLEDSFYDQFICGLRSEAIQRKLLAIAKAQTFAEATAVALA